MAPYNGAIEHSQGEFKNYLRHWQWKANTIDEFGPLAETAARVLNHRPRRCLDGQMACRVYLETIKCAILNASANQFRTGSAIWPPRYPSGPERRRSHRWRSGWRPNNGW